MDYHDPATGEVRFNERLLAFAGYWRLHPRACAPDRARTKGKDERGVGYVKRNAIAGHNFISWAALEGHLDWWMREIADQRVHGTTVDLQPTGLTRGEVPLTRFERDEAAALAPLNGRPPFGQLRELVRRVQADCAVAVDGNSYSVPWRLIGESVQVRFVAGRFASRTPARRWRCTPRPPVAANESSTRPTSTRWPAPLGRPAVLLPQ